MVAALAVAAAIVIALILAPRQSTAPPTTSPSAPTATRSPTSPSPSASPTASQSAPPAIDKDPVSPFISSAELGAGGTTVTVYGLVPGLTENGGVCRAEVVGGPAAAEGAATLEGENTTCPPLEITLPGPATAPFQVQLRYTSDTSEGVSDPLEVSP